MATKFPYSDLIGIKFLAQEKGKSHVQIKIMDFHFNPQNVVHGGVLYSLADTGFGRALYPLLNKGEICATIEIKMTYIKAVREGILDCYTKVLHRGKRVAMLEAELWNEEKLVAKASGSYAIFTPRSVKRD